MPALQRLRAAGLRTAVISNADADVTTICTHLAFAHEMDLIVTGVAVPHRLDPRAGYTAGPVRITAWHGAPAGPDDPARLATPEAIRAFENTEEELA